MKIQIKYEVYQNLLETERKFKELKDKNVITLKTINLSGLVYYYPQFEDAFSHIEEYTDTPENIQEKLKEILVKGNEIYKQRSALRELNNKWWFKLFKGKRFLKIK